MVGSRRDGVTISDIDVDINDGDYNEGDNDNVTQIRNNYDFKNSVIRHPPSFHNPSSLHSASQNNAWENEPTEKVFGDRNR